MLSPKGQGQNPVRLEGFGLDAAEVTGLVSMANQAADAGSYPSPEGQIIIHTGEFLRTAEDVKNVVISVHNGKPVYLRDVAEMVGT